MSVRLILFRENKKLALDLDDGIYVIGGGEPAQIVVPDPALAGKHAEISVAGETVTLTDLGGNRGTFVNGLRVMQYDSRVIKPGDQIVMGEAMLTLDGGEGGPPLPELPKPVLVVNGRVVRELHDGRYVVGRSGNADIQLDDSMASGRHAELEVSGGKVRIRDLGSTNGTWIDAGQLNPSEVEEMTTRSRVQIGNSTLHIQMRSADPPPLPDAPGVSLGAAPSVPAAARDAGILAFLFSAKGRTGRMGFWLGNLLLGIPYVALYVVALQAQAREEVGLACGSLILIFALLWPMMVIQIRRWHDRDKSGWWVFINFVPLIGPFWALIELGFLPGTPGPNQYGEN